MGHGLRFRQNPRDLPMTFFDFKTREVGVLKPENAHLSRIRNAREMVYVPEADVVLFGWAASTGGNKGGEKRDKKTAGRSYTLAYDCARNRFMLLDAGPTTYGHSSGWMYDAKRKNVYAINCHGNCWALHVDAETLKLLDKAPEE
jgi:hypothetical protein